MLAAEHALGARRSKGRSLYQVVCRDGVWVGLILGTGACWHLKARAAWIGWDPLLCAERLQLIVQQGRFLVLAQTREPNLASQILAAAVRDLPAQWEETFGYPPLLAEPFTDPESHAGTGSKASGWQAVGLSGREGRHYGEKFPEAARPKKIWVRALHPQARQRLGARELPAAPQAGVRCALKRPQLSWLYETFQRVPDPRSRKGQTYPIGAGLTLIGLGLLTGAVHLSPLGRGAQKLTQGPRAHRRLRFKKGTPFRPVPGYDVDREVLQRVDLEALAGGRPPK